MISILVMITTFILTYFVRLIAIKKSIVDTPNERSSHTVPTPRGGGLAIVLTWFLGITYLFFNKQINTELFYALISGIVLVITSLLDDIYDLKPKIRFVAQFISAGLALYFLEGFKILDLGFIKIENIWLLSSFAFIGIVWFINLYNFLDGIDGYAGMEAIFIAASFYILTSQNYYLIILFAALGFLVWNWQPAKIFMGDVGSTLLGFNFAVFAIYEQNIQSISLIIFLIISSLFWFDATYTLFRRWRNKEQLSKAHKKHAYQRFVQSGFSHQKTVLMAVIINFINFLLAYLAYSNPKFSILFLTANLLLLLSITYLIDKKKKFI